LSEKSPSASVEAPVTDTESLEYSKTFAPGNVSPEASSGTRQKIACRCQKVI
jgi:hypothetical protein